jgi:hypothetical protein
VQCPQPRPRTPTFLQTAQCVGLAIGCCVGHRARYQHVMALEAPAVQGFVWLPAAFQTLARLIIGYTVVILIDVLGKIVVVAMVKLLLGVDVNKPFAVCTSPD